MKMPNNRFSERADHLRADLPVRSEPSSAGARIREEDGTIRGDGRTLRRDSLRDGVQHRTGTIELVEATNFVLDALRDIALGETNLDVQDARRLHNAILNNEYKLVAG